ncbi:hypothetical protein BTVI_88357 [Pitangus sulphuratus]|nr:hypothetical protein BTVI_88357 [Pitangus sulphuratus]
MSAAPGPERPQVVSHAQQALSYTVFDCKWVPRSARLLCLGSAARGTGLVQLYELRGGRLELLREIEKPKPIKCGTFGATSLQQRYLATGDFDGNLNIWNLEAPEIPVYSVKGHKEIINSIDGVGGLGIGEGAPEIVTGSRDGTVKVWDPRQKDTPVANMEPVQGESKRDCWTVAFGTKIYHMAGQAPATEQRHIYDKWRIWEPSSLEIPGVAQMPNYYKSGFWKSDNLLRSIPSLEHCEAQMEMSEDDNNSEEYPTEIHDYLAAFEKSLGSVDEMLKTMMSVSRSELLQKLDPLEQAKLDLVSVYTLNSMFWVYLATQGINPKDHPVKQELERIRTYMNKVKEITDKKKASRLDKGAASRFVKNALWEPNAENEHSSKTPAKGKKRQKD